MEQSCLRKRQPNFLGPRLKVVANSANKPVCVSSRMNRIYLGHGCENKSVAPWFRSVTIHAAMEICNGAAATSMTWCPWGGEWTNRDRNHGRRGWAGCEVSVSGGGRRWSRNWQVQSYHRSCYRFLSWQASPCVAAHVPSPRFLPQSRLAHHRGFIFKVLPHDVSFRHECMVVIPIFLIVLLHSVFSALEFREDITFMSFWLAN